MYNKHRKNLQRNVNKIVRLMNKNIENDNLWRGRFYCRQKDYRYYWFEDGSGEELHILLEFRDKKTGIKSVKWFNIFCKNSSRFTNELFWEMNDFIIKDVKVWENEDPRKEVKDWRNI